MDLVTAKRMVDRGSLAVVGYGILTAMVLLSVVAGLTVAKDKFHPRLDAGEVEIVVPANLS